jgi:hypothetical protein
MIKLINLLKEFEYGTDLFSDLDDENVVNKQYITSLISKKEPNTNDEKIFLKALNKYFSDNIEKTIDVNVLNKLLQIKSKFPNILDPSKSKYSSAYRGTTIDIDVLLGSDIKFYNFNVYNIKSPNITIQSKGSTGYLSFSNSYQQAELFSIVNSKDINKLISTNTFPIISRIDLKNPKLLFNTEFTRAISEFDEEEFILVDNKFIPNDIFIVKPNNIFSKIKNIKKTAPKFYELQSKLNLIS